MTKLEKFQSIKKDFGLSFAVRYYYLRETKQYSRYIALVRDYLTSYLCPLIEEYQSVDSNIDLASGKDIWVCWWQGKSAMPDFCKMCYENLLYNTPADYTVHLITKDNYNEYAKIPDNIVRKMEAGKLSVTQFSDILRESLLYNNGGFWIDASVWVTSDYLSAIDFDASFWSIKLPEVDDCSVLGQVVSECKWSGFVLAGKKGNLLFKFLYEAMCKYFGEHDSTIDYFIQNILLRIAYENIPSIRIQIDQVPYSNLHLYELYRHMDEPFESTLWDELCSDTTIFKLTQKRPYKEFSNGKRTFYGYLRETNQKQQTR